MSNELLRLQDKYLQAASVAPSFGDYARTVGASFFDLAGAIPNTIAYGTAGVLGGPEPSDFEYAAKVLAEKAFRVGDDIRSMNTEGAQRLAAATFGSPEFWNHPFAWIGLQSANTAAPIISSVALAAFTGPGGAALINAGLAGVHSAGLTYESMVKDFDNQDLTGNPLYESLIDTGLSEQEAKREFKRQAIGVKPAFLFAATAAMARFSPSGQLVSKIAPTAAATAARAAAPHGIVRRVGEAIGMGAGEEGIQNTFEEGASQQARIDVGLQKDYNYGQLGEAFGSGAVVGGALGGIAGIPSGRQGALPIDETGDGTEDTRTPRERYGPFSFPDVPASPGGGTVVREAPKPPGPDIRVPDQDVERPAWRPPGSAPGTAPGDIERRAWRPPPQPDVDAAVVDAIKVDSAGPIQTPSSRFRKRGTFPSSGTTLNVPDEPAVEADTPEAIASEISAAAATGAAPTAGAAPTVGAAPTAGAAPTVEAAPTPTARPRARTPKPAAEAVVTPAPAPSAAAAPSATLTTPSGIKFTDIPETPAAADGENDPVAVAVAKAKDMFASGFIPFDSRSMATSIGVGERDHKMMAAVLTRLRDDGTITITGKKGNNVEFRVKSDLDAETGVTSEGYTEPAAPAAPAVREIGENRFVLESPGVKTTKSEGPAGITFSTNTPGIIQIIGSYLPAKARGKGIGLNLYRALADQAASEGKVLQSDTFVSPEALAVYKKLEAEGYNVEYAPGFHIEPGDTSYSPGETDTFAVRILPKSEAAAAPAATTGAFTPEQAAAVENYMRTVSTNPNDVAKETGVPLPAVLAIRNDLQNVQKKLVRKASGDWVFEEPVEAKEEAPKKPTKAVKPPLPPVKPAETKESIAPDVAGYIKNVLRGDRKLTDEAQIHELARTWALGKFNIDIGPLGEVVEDKPTEDLEAVERAAATKKGAEGVKIKNVSKRRTAAAAAAAKTETERGAPEGFDPEAWFNLSRTERETVHYRQDQGVKAAIRDPKTGKIYTGWTHIQALDNAPAKVKKSDIEPGFVKDGKFTSITEETDLRLSGAKPRKTGTLRLPERTPTKKAASKAVLPPTVPEPVEQEPMSANKARLEARKHRQKLLRERMKRLRRDTPPGEYKVPQTPDELSAELEDIERQVREYEAELRHPTPLTEKEKEAAAVKRRADRATAAAIPATRTERYVTKRRQAEEEEERQKDRERRRQRGENVPEPPERTTNPKFEAEKAAQRKAAGEVFDQQQAMPDMPSRFKGEARADWLDRLREHLQRVIAAARLAEANGKLKFGSRKTERKGPDVSYIIEARRLMDSLLPGRNPNWKRITEFVAGEHIIRRERLAGVDFEERIDPFLEMSKLLAGKRGVTMINEEGNIVSVEDIEATGEFAPTNDEPEAKRSIIDEIIADIKKLFSPSVVPNESWFRNVINKPGTTTQGTKEARAAAVDLINQLAEERYQERLRKGDKKLDVRKLTPAQVAARSAAWDIAHKSMVKRAQKAFREADAEAIRELIRSINAQAAGRRARAATAPAAQQEAQVSRRAKVGEKVRKAIETARAKRAARDVAVETERERARAGVDTNDKVAYSEESAARLSELSRTAPFQLPNYATQTRQQSKSEALQSRQMSDVWADDRAGPKRPPPSTRSARSIRFHQDEETNAAYEEAKLRRKMARERPYTEHELEVENAVEAQGPEVEEQLDELLKADESDLDTDDVISNEDLGRTKPAAELRVNLQGLRSQVKSRSDTAKKSDTALQGPYQRKYQPDVYVEPQRTTTVRETLAKLDWNKGFHGLKGKLHKSALLFLRRRLEALVGDMPIHVLSEFDMQTFLNEHDIAKQTAGAYIEDLNDPTQDFIVLSDVLFKGKLPYPTFAIRTILHEVVHAATNRGVAGSVKLTQDLEQLMAAVMKHHGFVDHTKHYGFKDIFEFIAEAMTNEGFQKLLLGTPLTKAMSSRFKAVNAFKAFVEWVRQAIHGPREVLNALEAAISVVEEVTTGENATVYRRDTGGTKKAAAKKSLGESLKEYADDTRTAVEERFRGIGLEESQTTPWFMSLRGMDQLSRDAKRFYGSDTNPVRVIDDTLNDIVEGTRKFMLNAESMLKAVHDVERAVGQEAWQKFAKFTAEVTNANLNPRVSLAENTHLGVDPEGNPSLKAAQAKSKHPKLAAEWRALDPKLKKVYNQVQDFMKARQQLMARLVMTNIVHEGMREADGTVPAEVNAALMDRIWRRKLTDADQKLLGNPLMKRIYSAKEMYSIGGDYWPQMRRGSHVVTAKLKVPKPKASTGGTLMKGTDNIYEFRGPDARQNAMDFANDYDGDAFVTGTTIDEKTGEAWDEMIDGTEMPGSRHKITLDDPDSIRVYRTEIQNNYVEFFDSMVAARRHAFELTSDPDIVSTTPAQARKYDPGDRGVDFLSSDVQQLIRALERRTDFKNMLPSMQNELIKAATEFSLQMMGSTRVHKRRMPKRKVRGASLDITRAIHDYVRATSSYTARLLHAQDLNDGVRALEESIHDPSLPRKGTAGRRAISNELKKRIDSGNGFVVFNKSWAPTLQRLLTTSFISRLASPMYTIMNLMQVPMVAYPVLAARYGHGAAFRTLTKAMTDLGVGKVLKKGVKETWRKTYDPRSPTETFIDELKARLKNPLEREVLDFIPNTGTLEIDRLQKTVRKNSGLAGQAGGAMDAFLSLTEGIARQMPTAAEVANRSVVLLATYRLEFAKNGGNHKAALVKAKDSNNMTNFNYGEVNAPPWFNTPLGKIAFQFKRFGHGMYQLIGQQIGRAIRNDEPGDRAEALKSLAYLAATHVLMAGTLGLPTEPIKGLVVGLFSVGMLGFNWQDFEDWQRELAADMVGPDLGEVLTRGITRGLPFGLGFDMSSRVGLADMFLAREPNTGDPETFKTWLQDMAFGAPGAMVFDWFKGTQDLVNGDIAAGLQKLVPVKGMRDLIKAADVGYRGKFTASGRPSFDPYTFSEMFLQAIGATPQRAAESQELRASFYSEQAYINERRGDIQQRWADASTSGRIGMRGEIERYNRGKPTEAQLKTKDLIAYTKRRRTEMERMESGISTNRANRFVLEELSPVYND